MAKKRILIVDDEAALTRVLSYALEETGAYTVATEQRATQALTTVKAFKPDVILLDVIMPDLDGGVVAEQLRDDPTTKAIPIVLLTAMASHDDVLAKGGRVGGLPFLAKPIDVKKVIACLERHLATDGSAHNEMR